MSGLENIEIRSETTAPGELLTGNVDPVLQEIAALLKQLLQTGEGGTIDLRSLPFTPDDHSLLKQRLGEGEVSATLDTLGNSAVRETAVTGVWWVTHFNAAGEIMAEFIEITVIPEILKSDSLDMREALSELEQSLKDRDINERS